MYLLIKLITLQYLIYNDTFDLKLVALQWWHIIIYIVTYRLADHLVTYSNI